MRDRVAGALASVHGVDVNPFATAIARFRLTVAALKAEGITRLADAPGYQLHVGTGDSLLHGKAGRRALRLWARHAHLYASEDLDEHPRILQRGRYHVVVGNPPYITVKDKALNEAYRTWYETCSGKYALSVPFAERSSGWRCATQDRPGYVGQITVELLHEARVRQEAHRGVLPHGQDLTHVIDTSRCVHPRPRHTDRDPGGARRMPANVDAARGARDPG